LPCWEADPPTTTAGVGVEEPEATGGDETAFFAVEAYDRVGCDALMVFEAWVGMLFCEMEVIDTVRLEGIFRKSRLYVFVCMTSRVDFRLCFCRRTRCRCQI